MMRLFLTGISILCALLICAFLIFVVHDTSTLVPPPGSVCKIFFKQLQTKRYSRAIPLLDSNLKNRADAAMLEGLKKHLETKIGKIRHMKSNHATITGDS